jgi:Zn-dependent protease/CBS domain-containing protein
MRGGIKVARILGINIFVDWSWILIFLLVTWHLSAGVFPTVHPEWSLSLTLAVSLTASLLFFGSVLAHELAHSVVARARGLPVRRITLFIFGGAADIGREPPTPGTEFLIAIVGPLMSALLGIIFLGTGLFLMNGQFLGTEGPLQALSAMGPIATLMLWLGPINILLAVFNMVPGFPLDGGRILRSILWAITNNMRRATRWATLVGQLVAWLFILTGIAMVFGITVPFFGTGILGGLWLAFIGWFLNNAASASYQHAVVQDMLNGVTVSRLMRPHTTSVESYLSLNALVYEYIIGKDERTFPVVLNDQLVGMISLEDVRKVPREEWERTRVSDIMIPAENLDIVSPHEDANNALEKISRRDARSIPVVQSGQLVGVLRRRDIVRWLQLQDNAVTGD